MQSDREFTWMIIAIGLVVLVIGISISWSISNSDLKKQIESCSETSILKSEDMNSLKINSEYENNKIEQLEEMIRNYHETHTYSLNDFFVCADMANDVWNLVKTSGINAKICVGNIEENLSNENYETILNNLNHAWVVAEPEPFKWIALETTGGYLVWGENMSNGENIENDLYYVNFCFENPKEFKRFVELRDNDYKRICDEANDMVNYWNENYGGKTITEESSEYKGKMEYLREECDNITEELILMLKN